MKIENVKKVVTLVVSIGAGLVATEAVKHVTGADTGTVKKVLMGIGGLAISDYVGDVVSEHARQSLDDLTDMVEVEVVEPEADASDRTITEV